MLRMQNPPMTPDEARTLCDRLRQAIATEQQALDAARAVAQEHTDALHDLARQTPSAAIARKRTALRAVAAEAQARVAGHEDRLRKLGDKLTRLDRALRQVEGVAAGNGPPPAASFPTPLPMEASESPPAPAPAPALPVSEATPVTRSEPTPAAVPATPAATQAAWIARLLGDQAGGFGGRIGPYRVERLLGSGSQATVFLAADAIRQVALKVIDADRVDAATWTALRKEARRLASIRHEHVVQVFGFDEVALDAGPGQAAHRVAYISLEYMPGGTLIDLEEREAGKGRRLPPLRSVEACLAAARGLAAIHAAGFVHCDIKPHNILTDGGDRFRVGDLGVAAEIGWSASSAAGTLAYLPPEIVAAHHARSDTYPIAPACDIYSLGATLFRLLTGRTPVQALAKDLAARTKHDRPVHAHEAFAAYKALPDPRTWQPSLPPAVANTVLTATAFDPQARYASADELVEALSEAHDLLRGVGSDSTKRRRWLW